MLSAVKAVSRTKLHAIVSSLRVRHYGAGTQFLLHLPSFFPQNRVCLLYTSDAADEQYIV